MRFCVNSKLFELLLVGVTAIPSSCTRMQWQSALSNILLVVDSFLPFLNRPLPATIMLRSLVLVACVSLSVGIKMQKDFDCPESWLGDHECDALCNSAQYNYDGGDCANINGCSDYWIGDGQCDEICNIPETNFDGGDCNIAANLCPPTSIGDNKCDEVCNDMQNHFDGGDCAPCHRDWIGNRECDEVCNTAEYNYDEGDCYQCPLSWLGDHECDFMCNNSLNNFDGGDCSH